jgi:hypothetical protein
MRQVTHPCVVFFEASNLPVHGRRVQQKSRHESSRIVALSVGHAAR